VSASDAQLVQVFSAELVLAQQRADVLKDQISLHSQNIRALSDELEVYRNRVTDLRAEDEISVYREIAGKTQQLAVCTALRDRARQEHRKAESQCRRIIASLHRMLEKVLTREARRRGSKLRKRLDTSNECPYCGDPLGPQPHADHIYPVSLGGRSEHWNMVYVCADCNALKSSMTLMGFIIRRGLDLQDIHRRLAALGKNF
jgi:5-methylcytosine-specific restriction endonuclease McrA